MGRITLAAALWATCITPGVAAAEYESWENVAVGVSCEVPPGFDVREPGPGEKAPARAVRLEWENGPYGGLRVLAVRREARYDSVAVSAGLFQRRLGASAAFEAEAEVLSPAELAAAGADDGIRAAYALTEGGEGSRLEVMFLSAGDRRYRVEVSYPSVLELQLGAAVERILVTFKILPAAEVAGEDPAEAGGAGDAALSE
ncbi:MAG TPA: hypothetical protein VMW93_05485 [bacterium]|nr:hypothetical protein [bacterium]